MRLLRRSRLTKVTTGCGEVKYLTKSENEVGEILGQEAWVERVPKKSDKTIKVPKRGKFPGAKF